MNITLSNYSQGVGKLDFSKMPEALKDGHQFMTDFSDLYNDDKTIKETIDLYIQKLNNHVSKAKIAKTTKKGEPKSPEKKPKNLAELKRYLKPGMTLYFFHKFDRSKEWQKVNVKREVKRIQSNSFSSLTPEGNESWLEWPKASEITFSDKGFKIDSGWVQMAYYYESQPVKTPKKETKAAPKKVDSKPAPKKATTFNHKDRKTAKAKIAIITKKAKRKREPSQEFLLEMANEINTWRSLASQNRDAKSDNKRRLSLTRDNLIRWAENPGRYDLIGVDTCRATTPTADLKRMVKKARVFNLYKV